MLIIKKKSFNPHRRISHPLPARSVLSYVTNLHLDIYLLIEQFPKTKRSMISVTLNTSGRLNPALSQLVRSILDKITIFHFWLYGSTSFSLIWQSITLSGQKARQRRLLIWKLRTRTLKLNQRRLEIIICKDIVELPATTT